MAKNPLFPRLYLNSLIALSAAMAFLGFASAAERSVIEIKDMTQMEVKSAGFGLPHEARIHITALGAGGGGRRDSEADMFAYGWIINADTREKVWLMNRANTDSKKSDRVFDGTITLPAGEYEVYYAAYGYSFSSPFSNFSINVDRRKKSNHEEMPGKRGFFSWFADIFNEDGSDVDWAKRARNWGITIAADEQAGVTTFAAPKPFRHTLFESVRMGENEHVSQPFTIARPMAIRIYALGEMDTHAEAADYAWIVDASTRHRFWQMSSDNTNGAGGAGKNVKADEVVNFPAGEYVLYYITDDSHSYVDWNAAPPYDPSHYGITLINTKDGSDGDFRTHGSTEEANVIVDLTRMRDNDSRSQSFTLKSDAQVRVYALGERSGSRREMADFGWIINAQTRQKVWSMDPDHTEHAGGAAKNRMADEVINLPKGTYTVYYQTDDSHAYNDWNSSPPFDPQHWGITVSLVGGAGLNEVEKNVTPAQTGVIAQIVRVGDNADRTEKFTLAKPTHVRIYALGEGQNREMNDYGWIENADGKIIWQMTYDMTFHAGGGRKNRLVNTTILLDKGSYRLRYESDDSHSFGDWNTDPPDDQTMWGITLYDEK